MRSGTRRYLLIIALLLLGLGLAWLQRRSLPARVSAVGAAGSDAPGVQAAQHVYFLDVEGWYRITPYETVVRSPYDLTATTTEAMAAALPAAVGEWQQAGPDEYVGDDPAVVFYLNHPTVALQRTYRDPSGQELTLAIIGNQGDDSFLLFSHTPETCYPGRLWQVTANRRESALLDDRPMHAQYLLTEHADTDQKLMVLYWYLWADPRRSSEDGVLSMRVNLLLPAGQSEEAVLARAWDFIRGLFPTTIPWDRF
jgi:EpsI family protein